MALTQVKTGGLTDGSVTAAKLAAGISSGGGTDWQSTIQTSNFTAAAGKGYFVNTTSGVITVTLPSGSTGDEIHLTDYASTFDTNEIRFSASGGQKIQGSTDTLRSIVENSTIRLVYQDNTSGWTGNDLVNLAVQVEYLVIAGGGGAAGGHQAGGGGAGGYRNSYASEASGGGGGTETPFSAPIGVNISLTVGAGGSGGPALSSQQGSANKGGDGGNSVFGSIISIGGGGSASYNNGWPNNIGRPGGSGGGAGASSGSVAASTRAAGTANQGYAGGGGDGYASPYGGAGGGGAGAVGSDSGGAGLIGNGGVGLQSSITGTAVFRGGGGGGATWGSNSTGQGGNGGGGNADTQYTSSAGVSNATAGSPNTGGGGGGPAWHTTVGGAGGSGVVILRYSDAYTIQETTSPAVLTFSTDSTSVANTKITTFTAGENGTIQFT